MIENLHTLGTPCFQQLLKAPDSVLNSMVSAIYLTIIGRNKTSSMINFKEVKGDEKFKNGMIEM